MSHAPTAQAPTTRTPGSPAAPSSPTQGESIALALAAMTVAAAGLYFTRSVFGPTFFAITLVITVRPVISWLVAHRVPRALAATGALLTIYAFVVGMFMAVGVAVAQLVETLPGYTDKFQALWTQAESLLAGFGVDESTLFTQLEGMVDTSKVVSLAQALLSQLSSMGSMLMVLALSVAFLMFDTAKIEGRTGTLTRMRPHLTAALVRFAQSVRSYWLVSTVFGLIVAVLDGVALGILGVPMAVTWAVVAFVTNYVPNIGFVLGVIPPALLALVDSGPWTALWVVVIYSVLNFVIQSVIQPKFTGDAVGINMTVTFVSLLFWSIVIGALGTILAVPLTLFVKALLVDSDPRSAWINVFLTSGDPGEVDPVQEGEEALEHLASTDLDGDGAGDLDEDVALAVKGLGEGGPVEG